MIARARRIRAALPVPGRLGIYHGGGAAVPLAGLVARLGLPLSVAVALLVLWGCFGGFAAAVEVARSFLRVTP